MYLLLETIQAGCSYEKVFELCKSVNLSCVAHPEFSELLFIKSDTPVLTSKLAKEHANGVVMRYSHKHNRLMPMMTPIPIFSNTYHTTGDYFDPPSKVEAESVRVSVLPRGYYCSMCYYDPQRSGVGLQLIWADQDGFCQQMVDCPAGQMKMCDFLTSELLKPNRDRLYELHRTCFYIMCYDKTITDDCPFTIVMVATSGEDRTKPLSIYDVTSLASYLNMKKIRTLPFTGKCTIESFMQTLQECDLGLYAECLDSRLDTGFNKGWFYENPKIQQSETVHNITEMPEYQLFLFMTGSESILENNKALSKNAFRAMKNKINKLHTTLECEFGYAVTNSISKDGFSSKTFADIVNDTSNYTFTLPDFLLEKLKNSNLNLYEYYFNNANKYGIKRAYEMMKQYLTFSNKTPILSKEVFKEPKI